MEPARNGRDDFLGSPGFKAEQTEPQWSPPVMGGMTGYPCWLVAAEPLPQWSPPVMGGMTLEVALLEASPLTPQWSPPVMGGMTREPVDEHGPADRAAMEPARNGRDDRSSTAT